MKLIQNGVKNRNIPPINYGPGKGIGFHFKDGTGHRALSPGDFKFKFPNFPQKALVCNAYKKAVKSMTGGDWLSCLDHLEVALKQLNGANIERSPILKWSIFLCYKWVVDQVLYRDHVVRNHKTINEGLVDRVMDSIMLLAFGDGKMFDEYIGICLDVCDRAFELEDIHLMNYLMRPAALTSEKKVVRFSLRLHERYIKLLELTAEDLLEHEIIEGVDDPYAALFRLYVPMSRGFYGLKLYESYIKGVEKVFDFASREYFLDECSYVINMLDKQAKVNPSDPIASAASTKLKQMIVEKFGGREQLVAAFSDGGEIAREMGAGEQFDLLRQTIFDFVFGLHGRNVLTLGSDAEKLLNDGDVNRASEVCEKIRKIFPDDRQNIIRLADVKLLAGEINEAETILRSFLNRLVEEDFSAKSPSKKKKGRKKKESAAKQKLGRLIGNDPFLREMNRRLKAMPAIRNAEGRYKANDFYSAMSEYLNYVDAFPFLKHRVEMMFRQALHEYGGKGDVAGAIKQIKRMAGEEKFGREFLLSDPIVRKYILRIFESKFKSFVKARAATSSEKVAANLFNDREFAALIDGIVYFLMLGRENEAPTTDMLRKVFTAFISEEIILTPAQAAKELRLIKMTRTPVVIAAIYRLDEAIKNQPPGRDKRRVLRWFSADFVPMFGELFSIVRGFGDINHKTATPEQWSVYEQLIQFTEHFCEICANHLSRSGEKIALDIMNVFVEYMDKVKDVKVRNWMAYSILLTRSLTFLRLGMPEEALKDAEAMLVLPKQRHSMADGMISHVKEIVVDASVSLGTDYWKDEIKDEKKLRHLQRAIELLLERRASGPKDFDIISNLGATYHEMGDFEKAIQLAREALAIKEGYDVALFNIIHSYLDMGKLAECLDALKEMAEHEKNAESVLLYNAMMLVSEKFGFSYVEKLLNGFLPEYDDVLADAIFVFEKEKKRPAPIEFKKLVENFSK